jgi:hypothetical protein
MKYMKPEIIDLDVAIAGGAACNNGTNNYSTGCTGGLANEVNCNSGTAHGSWDQVAHPSVMAPEETAPSAGASPPDL